MGDFLSDKLSIETPEQIRLEFPLAGIGSRFLALAYDKMLQFLASAVLAGFVLVVAFPSVVGWSEGGVWTAALVLLIFFLIEFGYFAFFEAYWGGQTPGKRRLHLRVIRENGQPITTYDAISRNLLRIIDGLPGFYAVGILSALVSSQNKRLGDYLAGTVVVREKPLEQHVLPSLNAASSVEFTSVYDVGQLTPEEFQLLEAYLFRRDQLQPDVRAHLAGQIIQRLTPRLSISPEDRQHPESLLERLVSEYRDRIHFR